MNLDNILDDDETYTNEENIIEDLNEQVENDSDDDDLVNYDLDTQELFDELF